MYTYYINVIHAKSDNAMAKPFIAEPTFLLLVTCLMKLRLGSLSSLLNKIAFLDIFFRSSTSFTNSNAVSTSSLVAAKMTAPSNSSSSAQPHR